MRWINKITDKRAALLSAIKAMLKFSRKQLNQRTKKPIAKHGNETLKV